MSSSFETFLRFLDKSWRLFAAFRVEVRLHITTLILALIFVVNSGPYERGSDWLVPLGAITALYVLIWFHEMGHITAAWRYRIPAMTITLSPLGGLAHLQGAAPGPKAEILISLAGPATHLLALPVIYVLKEYVFAPDPYSYLSPGGRIFWWLWYQNLFLLAFNLLPFYPLDGGRVLRSLLAIKMHPTRATILASKVGIAGGIGIAIYGIAKGGPVLGAIAVILGINNIFLCRREMIMAQFSEGPYGPRFMPWETSGEEWKLGGEEEAPKKLGFLARLRAKRAAVAEVRRRREIERAEVEIDRLLAKVSEVGMSGLTKTEREALIHWSRIKKEHDSSFSDRPRT